MGDVDDGGAQSLVQLCDLGSHLDTELCIQVGERLVHQEDLGVTDNCTSHCNTLSLAAGESLRLAVKELGQIEDLRCVADHLVDLILRNLAELESECHVVIDSHVRIQSIVLEDHGDIAVLGLDIIHDLAVDLEGTGGDVLQTCDHTKGSGLSASGGADEDDELLVCNLQVEILHCLKSVGIFLVNML